MRCPNCQSYETETLGTMDLIDSGSDGDLVNMEAYCLRCGHRFTFDEFVPRPERTVEQ